MTIEKPETKLEMHGHHVHSLYIGQFEEEFIIRPYITPYSLHKDGFSESFLHDSLEKVQYPLFGRWGLIGEKGGNNIYADRCSVYIFGQYYGRDGLDLKTRGLLVLSALAVLLREGVLPTWANACRNLGWSEEQLKELGALVSHIAGFPPSRGSLMMMDDVFDKRRALTGESPDGPPPAVSDPNLYEKARELATRLFGNPDGDFDDIPMAPSDDFRKEMVTWVFGYLFTERSLIPLRTKVLAVVAMSVACGRMAMARRWIGAARNAGCKRVELQEAMLTMALYGGWPVAREGLDILQEEWPLEA